MSYGRYSVLCLSTSRTSLLNSSKGTIYLSEAYTLGSINQTDLTERNEQVSRMANIYTHVERVVVWLGPELREADMAFSKLKLVGRQIQVFRNRYLINDPEVIQNDWYEPTTVLSLSETNWDAIFELLSLPWFERLWIWQEIQFASPESVPKCGEYEIEWPLFRRSCACLFNKNVNISTNLLKRLSIAVAVAGHAFSQTHPEFFNSTASSKCTLLSDKIYGIYGLLPSFVSARTQSDYNLSQKRCINH